MLSEQDHVLAQARAEFLSTGRMPPGLRPSTARSWQRSLAAEVRPDGPLDLAFVGVPDGGNALLRAAQPVAQELLAETTGARAAMLLVDSRSRVLNRWTADEKLAHHLDSVGGGPGFLLDESRVGTCGLGTALEELGPVIVIGSEHFSAPFVGLTAVGAPVLHPVSGRIEGAVDMVCPTDDASELMLPLVIRAAREIGMRLLSGYAGADRALLDGFLRAERGGPRRPMLAVNGRLLMSNSHADDVLRTTEHAVIWGQVQRGIAERRAEIALETDADGSTVWGSLTEVRDVGDCAGVVVRLRRSGEQPDSMRSSPGGASRLTSLKQRLPGRSREWNAVVERSCALFARRERVLLLGESGVGKRALACAVCDVHEPYKRLVEHDARDAVARDPTTWLVQVTSTLDPDAAGLLLTRLDHLDNVHLDVLCRWLDGLPTAVPPVLATYETSDGTATLPAALAAQFPHVITVPRLQDRPEDVASIAATVAPKRAGRIAVRIDGAAVRQLTISDWPGNVRQLRRVVSAASEACPGTLIRVTDLPLPFRTRSTRRPLSRLERLERDAIVTALGETHGNKLKAAASLGISRSTLYRKLHVLGLED